MSVFVISDCAGYVANFDSEAKVKNFLAHFKNYHFLIREYELNQQCQKDFIYFITYKGDISIVALATNDVEKFKQEMIELFRVGYVDYETEDVRKQKINSILEIAKVRLMLSNEGLDQIKN
ncbi:Uncharacterised protein [uncultured archaeon]|nr:Uncharacterised protein [uncultured archaeon]